MCKILKIARSSYYKWTHEQRGDSADAFNSPENDKGGKSRDNNAGYPGRNGKSGAHDSGYRI